MALAVATKGAQVSLEDRPSIRASIPAYLYLLPAVVILGLFHFLPIFYAFYISLFNWRVAQGPFVGLGNYQRAFDQPDFWNSIVVTVFFVLGTVPVSLCLAFLIAYLLFQQIAGRGLYRVLYFLPYVTSVVAAALAWKWIFHRDYGILNAVFGLFEFTQQKWLQEPTGVFRLMGQGLGISVPPELAGPSLALVAVMIFSIWHGLGFDIIILLAGLTNIAPELYDAARIDGARGLRLLRHITIPLLSPTLFFLSTVSIIRSFQAFIQIFILTGSSEGRPIGTTQAITLYIFDNFYSNSRIGYGAAVAFILFFIILTLTGIQLRVVGRRVHY